MAAALTMNTTPKNFHDSIRSLWQGTGNAASSTTSMSSMVEKQASNTTDLLMEQRAANKEIIGLLSEQVKMLKRGGIGGGGFSLLEALGFGALTKGAWGAFKTKLGSIGRGIAGSFRVIASAGMALLRPLEGLKNIITSSGVWKQITALAPKISSRGIMTGVLRKFGLFATAALGLVDFFSGWKNAESILGKAKATFTDKMAAAFGTMWNNVFLGIPDMVVQYFGGSSLASFGSKVGIFVKESFKLIGSKIPGVSLLVDRIEKSGGIGNLVYGLFDNVRVSLWEGIKGIGLSLKEMITETADNIRKNFKDWLFGGNVPKFFSGAVENHNAGAAGAAIGGLVSRSSISGGGGSSTSTTSSSAASNDGSTNFWKGDTSAPAVEAAISALPTDYSKVVDAGSGFTTVTDSNGRVVKREGTRNWRNNNPGNIEAGDFANSMGAVGSDGRFAVFPSYEAGRKAKEKLFFEGKNYRDKNLIDAIARYAPPSENNTLAYAQAIANATGTNLNTPISSFTPEQRIKALDAMQKVEGFKVGKETVLNPGRLPMMPIADGHSGTAGNGSWEGVDPRLKHLYEETSKVFPLRNRMMSGKAGRSSGNHAAGNAFDITLYDQAGNPLPSYQEGTAFRAYELFAQTMHKKAQELYPELVSGKGGEMLDWGGLFGGDGRGNYKYGSNDLMDFRINTSDKTRAGNIMTGLQGGYKGWYDKNDVLGGSKPYSEEAYRTDMMKLHNFTLSEQQKRNATYFGVAKASPFLGPNKAITPTSVDLGIQNKAKSVNFETPSLGKTKQVSPAFDQALDATVLNRNRVPSFEPIMQPVVNQENPLTGNSGSGSGSYKVSDVPSMDEMKMLLINGSAIT